MDDHYRKNGFPAQIYIVASELDTIQHTGRIDIIGWIRTTQTDWKRAIQYEWQAHGLPGKSLGGFSLISIVRRPFRFPKKRLNNDLPKRNAKQIIGL